MTVCGKPGKTIKLFSHPSHKPWKLLRDSHIPSALRLIISIQFSNQKRSLPQLPIPLTFRLILQLEKTEAKKIFLVTRRALLLSLSPLFYEDDQICICPAPISCLWERYLRAAGDAFG